MSNQSMQLLRSIHSWDVSVFLSWQIRVHERERANFWRGVSKTADGWPYLVASALYAAIDPANGVILFQALFMAFVLERLLYQCMKKGFKRQRPPQALPDFTSIILAADEFSFPSGHTSGAFLFVTMCTMVFGPIAAIGYVWAIMVAISRISLGVHFPTDTVVGAVLGMTVALLTFPFFFA